MIKRFSEPEIELETRSAKGCFAIAGITLDGASLVRYRQILEGDDAPIAELLTRYKACPQPPE